MFKLQTVPFALPDISTSCSQGLSPSPPCVPVEVAVCLFGYHMFPSPHIPARSHLEAKKKHDAVMVMSHSSPGTRPPAQQKCQLNSWALSPHTLKLYTLCVSAEAFGPTNPSQLKHLSLNAKPERSGSQALNRTTFWRTAPHSVQLKLHAQIQAAFSRGFCAC